MMSEKKFKKLYVILDFSDYEGTVDFITSSKKIADEFMEKHKRGPYAIQEVSDVSLYDEDMG